MFALLAVFATSMGFQYDDWKQSILCLVSGDLPSAGTVCDLMGQWVTTYETLENVAKQQPNFEAWKEASKYINPNNAFRSIVIGRPGSIESDLAKIDSGYVLSVYVYGDWTNTPIDLNKLGRRCVVSITHLTGSATTLSDPKPVIEKLVKLQESASKNKVSAKQFSELSKQIMQEYVTVPKTAADDTKVIKLVCNEDLSKKVDHLDLVSGVFAMEGSGCKVPSLGFEDGLIKSYEDAQKLEADWCLSTWQDGASAWAAHQALLPEDDNDKPFLKCGNMGLSIPALTMKQVNIRLYEDGFGIDLSEKPPIPGLYPPVEPEKTMKYKWYKGTLSLVVGTWLLETIGMTMDKTVQFYVSVDSELSKDITVNLNVSAQSLTELPATVSSSVGIAFSGHVTEWPLYLPDQLKSGLSNIADPATEIVFGESSNWDKVTLNLIGEAKKTSDVTVTGSQPTKVSLSKHSIDERSAGEGRNDPDAQNKADNPVDPSGLGTGGIIGIISSIVAAAGGVYYYVRRQLAMRRAKEATTAGAHFSALI